MIKGLIRLAGVAMLGAAAMGLASCSPSEAPTASAGTEEAPATETTSGSDALAGIGVGGSRKGLMAGTLCGRIEIGLPF